MSLEPPVPTSPANFPKPRPSILIMKRNDDTETARDDARDTLETSPSPRVDLFGAQLSDNGADEYDPLKPENLRIDQSELDEPAVKAELTEIPVRKPDKFEFIRVHPDPACRCNPVAFISLRGSGFYIVPPSFRKNLRPREYYLGTLFLVTTRLEKPFLWIVTTQSPTGKVCDWYTSALECAERAMKAWVQVVSDQDAGHYAVVVAEDELEEPEWPVQSFAELIKLGFKRRTVNSLDHPVFKQLRGRI